jgi:trehalose-6-phosphate synthase
MTLEERRSRYEALMAAVRKHDVTSWCHSFLARLERVRGAEAIDHPYPPGPLRAALAKLGGQLDAPDSADKPARKDKKTMPSEAGGVGSP